MFPGVHFVIADSDEEAAAREDERIGKLDFEKSLIELGRSFNYHDFRRYDPDAPFPDVSNLSLNSYKGAAEKVIALARSENLTLRQTVERVIAKRRSAFVGTPKTVADEIERWFVAGAADGFNVRVGEASDFDRFAAEVLPLLQERGLFRREYESDTLRGHFGLPFPENRYASARQAAE